MTEKIFSNKILKKICKSLGIVLKESKEYYI